MGDRAYSEGKKEVLVIVLVELCIEHVWFGHAWKAPLRRNVYHI